MNVIFQRVGDPAADLSWERRQRDMTDLADNPRAVDVVVIGGGITGAGVALDAAGCPRC